MAMVVMHVRVHQCNTHAPLPGRDCCKPTSATRSAVGAAMDRQLHDACTPISLPGHHRTTNRPGLQPPATCSTQQTNTRAIPAQAVLRNGRLWRRILFRTPRGQPRAASTHDMLFDRPSTNNMGSSNSPRAPARCLVTPALSLSPQHPGQTPPAKGRSSSTRPSPPQPSAALPGARCCACCARSPAPPQLRPPAACSASSRPPRPPSRPCRTRATWPG